MLLLCAACASQKAQPAPHAPESLLREAERAVREGRWEECAQALEKARLVEPRDPYPALFLARVRLCAFGDVEQARRLAGAALPLARSRALHLLGLCALAEGDAAGATDLLEQSIEVGATAACARDLALLRLAGGATHGAEEALDLVTRLSAQSYESEVVLAAAGRLPAPPDRPGPENGLSRARLAAGADPARAAREVNCFLDYQCATPLGRQLWLRMLALQFPFSGNTGALRGVQ